MRSDAKSPYLTPSAVPRASRTVIEPWLERRRAAASYREATDPDRVAVLSPDMRRIRARQQEVAAARAIAAEEERRRKEKEEREEKRVKTPEEERWEKRAGEGRGLRGGEVKRAKKTFLNQYKVEILF